MPYIFFDESGDLAGDQIFTLSSFTTHDLRGVENKFTDWLANHFPLKISRQGEIKFPNPDIAPPLRQKTLEPIASLPIQVRSVQLHTKYVPLQFYDQDGLRSGWLYIALLKECLMDYLPITDGELHVICDQRTLKKIRRGEFLEIIEKFCRKITPPGTLMEISLANSASLRMLQLADWLAGGIASGLGNEILRPSCEVIDGHILEEDPDFRRILFRQRSNRVSTPRLAPHILRGNTKAS